MIVYEFYSRDSENREKLIGVLPERRKDPKRISAESIMRWVEMVLGNTVDMSNIFFVQVTID